MKVSKTKEGLLVQNGATKEVRIISGIVCAYLIFKIVRYTFLGFSMMLQWHSPIYLVFNGRFFVILFVLAIASYIASNNRTYLFTKEGIKMTFGPRVYALLRIKEEFISANDIKTLIILPYRSRTRGLPMYGLHAGRYSTNKPIDFVGSYNKQEILDLAQDVRVALGYPELTIITR